MSHGQTISVLTEQLAALEALQHSTEQGYRLVTDGLRTIGSIRDGEFQVHHAFFGSLSAVNTQLSGDPKLKALERLQASLFREISVALDYWRRQRSQQP
jgi:hypothetical protein